MLLHQIKSRDTSGLGYSSESRKSKPECSLNQEVLSVDRAVHQLKISLSKIHEPLNEAQRQLVLREKDCTRLQNEITSLKKPDESQTNRRDEDT